MPSVFNSVKKAVNREFSSVLVSSAVLPTCTMLKMAVYELAFWLESALMLISIWLPSSTTADLGTERNWALGTTFW